MQYLAVFIGGGLGSMCRFACAQWFPARVDGFPWGTFVANSLACLILGVGIALATKGWLSSEQRLLLLTGFCGGFSTFSTFSVELLQLGRSGHYGTAGLYLITSLLVGLLAIGLGSKIVGPLP